MNNTNTIPQYTGDFKGYLGNSNVKKAGVKVQFTPDMVREIAKCKNDPVYFAETYMKIVNADGDLISFELYDYQREILTAMHENRRVILLQARQSGKTTTIASYILWYILFNRTKNVAILGNTGATAQEILKKIQDFYEYIPVWLQQGVIEWNKTSIELENKSRIITGACTKSSIRGKTIQFMLIDETAFVENWDEFFTSTFNTMANSKKSKIALVSTPYGVNHFAKFWEGATHKEITKRNGWYPVKVTWRDVPGRDDKWKEEILKGTNFDYEKFAQEHDVEFLGSSGTLISGWRLKEMLTEVAIPIQFDHTHCQYEKPFPNEKYIIICDVSEGKGLDYSTMQVVRVSDLPYFVVYVYRSNTTTPLDFAEVIFRTAKHYNGAAVLVETNNMGGQVADSLWYDFEYENLIQSENKGRAGKQATLGFGGNKKELGIKTTLPVKANGCSLLKLLIEQRKLLTYDKNTIDEFITFARKNKTWQAEPGNHDDLVMPLVLFAWLTDQDYFKELTDINTLQLLRDKTEDQMMDELLPFGIIDDGMDYVDADEIKTVPSIDRWLFDL